MSLSLRKRARELACIIPGVRSSAASVSKGHRLEDDEDDQEDDCSRLLIEDNSEETEGKPYNLSSQVEALEPCPEQPLQEQQLVPCKEQQLVSFQEQLHPLNDLQSTHSVVKVQAMSPTPAMTFSDTGSSFSTWPEMTRSFADMELDQASITSTMTPSSLRSAGFSAPNSPVCSTGSFHSLQLSPGSLSSSACYTAPVTPTSTTRSSRLPLTTPLPRRNPHRRAHSASGLLLPASLPPPPCEQVQNTMALLKSIKKQINALKRRESHLSTKLHVQRRERQQVQEQIAHLEARRLRVEAMFVRPLPLVLLLPVAFSLEDEYDLCLVSEGQDAWNALQPLIRIQLVRGSVQGVISSRMGALLLHFGPTLTQPMAAAVSFLQHDPVEVPHLDLQPSIKHMDPSFWERTTCGQVLEADAKQLSEPSCQFLFEALTEHKHLWRNQLTQVVDKKTRRVQWILQNEADSLYYEAIPASPSSPTSMALVELE